MIASFFQRLEATGVHYLLISGQATILYGAAMFSEGVDLWVEPTDTNVECFVAALQASAARYYKLTPPLTVSNLLRGHGFHFVLPGDGDTDTYLDVMGRPPRVGSFEQAVQKARYFDTDFGRVHTVGIKELVELKKTQRPADYPVIGRLACAYLEDPAAARDEAELRWALDNVFGLPELRALLAEYPEAFSQLSGSLTDLLVRAVPLLARAEEVSASLEDELDAWFEARTSALRRADRRYWRSIIEELRVLRREGRLMPEGAPV